MAVNPYARPDISEVLAARKPRSRLVMVFVVGAILAVVVALLLPAVQRGGGARRFQSRNNLKQIVFALHNYADAFGALPPACTFDSGGTPLHSWRTLILPFLEESSLYATIDLSKPWDDPANARARESTVFVFGNPGAKLPPQHTTCLGVVTETSCLRPGEPRLFADITDGTSNTLLLVDVPAANAVHWMAPQDADESLILAIRPNMGLTFPGGFNVAFVDGSTRFLSENLTAAQRLALISAAGGDSPGEF